MGVAGDKRALRARRRRAAALLLVGLLGVVDELLAELVQQQQLRLPVGVEVLGEVDRQQLADGELEAEAVERLERRREVGERSAERGASPKKILLFGGRRCRFGGSRGERVSASRRKF